MTTSNGGPKSRLDFALRIPEGDDRERLVCNGCGWVHYVNPRIVVGSVATWDGRILLCRRKIEPRAGFWTLPAGFLEEGETPEEGARREAREEAEADIRVGSLLAVYAITRISQVQLFYRAELATPDIGAGPESLEVMLATPDEIPWADLAFPSVHWALEDFAKVRGLATFPPFGNPPADLRGTGGIGD